MEAEEESLTSRSSSKMGSTQHLLREAGPLTSLIKAVRAIPCILGTSKLAQQGGPRCLAICLQA